MELNQKLKVLTEKEYLLKDKAEDRKEEIAFLTERLEYLLNEEVSDTQKLNLLQVDIEELKR